MFWASKQLTVPPTKLSQILSILIQQTVSRPSWLEPTDVLCLEHQELQPLSGMLHQSLHLLTQDQCTFHKFVVSMHFLLVSDEGLLPGNTYGTHSVCHIASFFRPPFFFYRTVALTGPRSKNLINFIKSFACCSNDIAPNCINTFQHKKKNLHHITTSPSLDMKVTNIYMEGCW